MCTLLTAPNRAMDYSFHWLHEYFCETGANEPAITIDGQRQCYRDEDNYHLHTAYQPRNETGKKLIKRVGYNVVALVGNTMRFLTYLTLSILFPIGLMLGALCKKKTENAQRDYGMVYRRAGKNLFFIHQNLAMILTILGAYFIELGKNLSRQPTTPAQS